EVLHRVQAGHGKPGRAKEAARRSPEVSVGRGGTMSDTRLPEPLLEHSRRVLTPLERFGETVFGLIMVLTITGSISVAEAGHAEIRTMLIGALGWPPAGGVW